MNKKVELSKHVLPLIKSHAKSFPVEIYGWLLGCQERDSLKILTAISCENYTHQTLISADPNPSELIGLANALPFGIHIVGIYHSHPGEVFHSHVDDETLVTFGKTFPNAISIVTNGDEVEVFRYEEGTSSMVETDYQVVEFQPITPFSLETTFDLIVRIPEGENDNVHVANQVRAMLRETYNKATFVQKGTIISSKTTEELNPKEPIIFQLDTPSEVGTKREQSTSYSLNLGVQLDIFLQPSNVLETLKDRLFNALVEDISQQISKGKTSGSQFILGRTLKVPYFDIPLKFYLSPKDLSSGLSSFMNGFGSRIDRLKVAGYSDVADNLEKIITDFSVFRK